MQLHHVSNQSVRVKEINNQLLPPTHPPGISIQWPRDKQFLFRSQIRDCDFNLCDRKDNSEVKMEYTNLLANQLYTN